MIGWLAALAIAGPVVLGPTDRFAACVVAADGEAGMASSAPSADLGSRVDRVAVVVGVPCHHSPEVPSLAYSSRDAARVAEALEAGGYRVLRLTSAVALAGFDRALDEAEAALSPHGTLVVYFSGHGVLRQEGGVLRRYLVFSDTELADLGGTALSVVDLDDRVSRIPAADRVVLQDTCFAARPELGGKSVVVPFAEGARPKGLALLEGHLALHDGDQRLYASRFFEQAVELVEDRASLYTHHFLGALDAPEADLDGDGCVGSLEAHTWSAARTAAARGGFQTPQIRAAGLRNVPLRCVGEPRRAVVAALAGPELTVELREPGGRLVRRGTGAVDPGRYHLEVGELAPRGEDLVRRRRYAGPVRLEAGDWLDVPAVVEARGPAVVAGVGVGALDLGAGAGLAMGAAGGWRGRDLGRGRVSVGGLGAVVPPAHRTDGPCARFSGGQLTPVVGWQWVSRGPVEVAGGPVAGLGGTWRTPYDACRTDPPRLATQVAPHGVLGGQAELRVGTAALLFHGGVVGVPERRAEGRAVLVGPFVGALAGVAL